MKDLKLLRSQVDLMYAFVIKKERHREREVERTLKKRVRTVLPLISVLYVYLSLTNVSFFISIFLIILFCFISFPFRSYRSTVVVCVDEGGSCLGVINIKDVVKYYFESANSSR